MLRLRLDGAICDFHIFRLMTVEELQDEISAVDAIYPDCVVDVAPQIYNFKIPEHDGLELQMSFPEGYPDEAPNLIQIIIHDPVKFSDPRYLETSFNSKLLEVYRQGEVCMFEFLSELEVILNSYKEREVTIERKVEELQIQEPEPEPESEPKPKEPQNQVDPLEGWIQSDAVVDRGSTFIGFTRKVTSLKEAQDYLDLLVTEKKISKAAHNMSAWRIKGEGGVQYQDCDDDGEAAAGGRLLHLLTVCIKVMTRNGKVLTF